MTQISTEFSSLLSNCSYKELDDLMYNSESEYYEERPVDIETFYNDPYYLGQTYGGRVYKIWQKTLREIYPIPMYSPYYEVILSAAIGAGKCLGKGTKVLMSNGTIKNVEDIQVGDFLMGDDSTPRKVLSTCVGQEPLYRIIPNKGSEPFICNESHVLSLKCTSTKGGYIKDSVVNISVRDYLKKSNNFKNYYKLYRTAIDFPKKDLELDPYLVGLWLGDGSTESPRLWNPEKEIIDYCLSYNGKDNWIVKTSKDKRYSEKDLTRISFSVADRKKGTNKLINFIKNSTKDGSKRIPIEYLTSDRNDRLRLLAGIIDTDGFAGYRNINKGCRVVTTKLKGLAEDYAYLARSLGFKVSLNKRSKKLNYKNDAIYVSYDVSISGDLTSIPCLVPRKRCTESHYAVDPLKTGFKIEPLGVGDYYGFEIDGNRLFCLADFTVTHNTTVSTIGMLYDIHKLFCLKNPQEYYNLTPNTIIAFSLFSATLSLSQDVNWTALTGALAESPYFMSKLLDSKSVDQKAKTSMILLSKNIGLQIGSNFKHTVGKAVFGSLLDEASFQSKTAENDQAQNTYNALTSRAESRFADSVLLNPLPGHQWLASSPFSATDFLTTKISKSEGRKGLLIKKDIALWHAKEHLMSDDIFYVFIGDKENKPEILDDITDLPESKLLLTHKVPSIFRASFEENLELNIMDKLGVSINSSAKLFKTIEAINTSMSLENPFKKPIIDTLSFAGEDSMMDYMNLAYFRNPRDKHCNRFLMVDAGATGDVYGIACVYCKSSVDIVGDETAYAFANRIYVCDFACGVKAKKGERVNFSKIEAMTDFLISIGYPIVKVGADQFQSEHFLQSFMLKDIETERVSVVSNPKIYEDFRDRMEENKIFLPKVERLKEELGNLKKVPRKRSHQGFQYFYDHPSDGSKDLSDAVAGAYWLCRNSKNIINSNKMVHEYFEDTGIKDGVYLSNLTDEEFLEELKKSK